MKFGHIALRVKNIDKMLKFYVDGFGFQEAFRIHNDDGSLRIVYLHIADGQFIELCLGGEERPEFDDKKSIGFRHISFTVEDIQETKNSLESNGIVFDSEIIEMRDNNLAAFLFDPEGNKIELMQITAKSPQSEFINHD